MPSSEGAITHVSDTALMVAACRAHETELEDAFVRDPFAARLSGSVDLPSFARCRMRTWWGSDSPFARASLMNCCWKRSDHSIATVLSVGCGLDTRPWRLDFDKNLRWIEVDFAGILDYKDELMKGEAPRCRRERLTVDVNDTLQRQIMYQSTGSESALMITEGLLMYLPAATVEALAAEAFNGSVIRHWISDITTSGFSRVLGGGADTTASIRHVQAPDRLEGEQILETIL